MAVHAFVVLPYQDDDLLNFAGSLDQHMDEIVRVVLAAKPDATLYIDPDSISVCTSKIEALGVYFEDKIQQLRMAVGRTARDIQTAPLRLTDGTNYFIWHLDRFAVNYAPPILAEAAERMQQYASEQYVLMLFAQALPRGRAFIPIFKDALHKPELPGTFTHLPFVTDAEELALWLATHHVKSFSLRDTTRFEKTSHVKQGKAVYQERETSYFWHLDNLHKDHYEVYDSRGSHLGEANLQGELNRSKAKPGRQIEL
ncbi:MAG: hypothetical protein NW241_04215 [Bacteroidia bacterium]|nr:hypothetical protein [Bacteroidia bacterium]